MANIRQRNGKWQVQVRRRGGRKTKTLRTKADAERWSREQESLIDRGLQVDPAELARTSVRALLERFQRECLPERKGARWETVRIAVLMREEWTLRRLDQDVAGALRAWVQQRQREVSSATVNRELNFISAVFTTAMKQWALPMATNPVSLVHRPAVDRTPRGRMWGAEDLDKMRVAAARLRAGMPSGDVVSLDYVLPALELSIETAMRRGEMCSALAADVDLVGRHIWLPPEVTKTGVGRHVPLSTRAVAIVERLLAMRGRSAQLMPVHPDTLGIRFREVRAAAGLEGLRLHDGRHTATTRASEVFDNVLELAAFTGHRDLKTLQRYYHPDPTKLAKRLG